MRSTVAGSDLSLYPYSDQLLIFVVASIRSGPNISRLRGAEVFLCFLLDSCPYGYCQQIGVIL